MHITSLFPHRIWQNLQQTDLTIKILSFKAHVLFDERFPSSGILLSFRTQYS